MWRSATTNFEKIFDKQSFKQYQLTPKLISIHSYSILPQCLLHIVWAHQGISDVNSQAIFSSITIHF